MTWVGPEEMKAAMQGNLTCQCSVCDGPARSPEDVVAVHLLLGSLPVSYLAVCEGCMGKVAPTIAWLREQDIRVLTAALEIINLGRWIDE